jgi:uncharacterized protein
MHVRWTVSLAALAAVTLVLAGCAAVPRGPAPSAEQAAALVRQGNAAGAAQMYAALADESRGAQRNGFALQAADAYLAARRPDDAVSALDLLSAPLTAGETFDRALIEVRVALQRGQAAHAWQLIQAVAPPPQAAPASRYFRLRQRAAFAAGQPAAGIEAETQLEHWLLNAAAVQQSRVALLDDLRAASERGVQMQPAAAASPVVRGWLELAPLAAATAHDPTAAAAELTAWLAQHPGHPAAAVVRSQLLGEQPQPLAAQAHIALLLPITGPAARAAASVRDGFLTAYYQAPAQQRPVVRVYDSGAQPIADLIARATQAGADIIVGPLLRQAVAAAAADRAQRPPLLALNFLPQDEQGPPLFFQFALSPVEEAKLVAQRVLSDGYHLGIAIVPAGDWGSRVLAAFEQQLQSGGGTVLASTMIDPTEADYSAELKQVLGIDQSRARLDRLESLLGTRLQFVPRRREDIQFIFAPAQQPSVERLLQPQLRFFYAGGIPTYATSDAFDPDPRANQDLDGLMFPAMPWMLGSPLAEAVQSAASQAWPAGGPDRGRLFAFGFDAYRLAQALRENSAPAALGISGLTGQLTLAPDGRIRRQLIWAQLRGGEATELPGSPGG